VSRYGRVRLEKHEDKLRLICKDKPLLEELARQPKVKQYLGQRQGTDRFVVEPAHRGVLKQALIAVGYPAEDLAGYTEGAALPLQLRTLATSGMPFVVRDYQRDAAEIFFAGGDVRGGSGVIVLPCGAGKTIVGIAAMALCQRNTLVLTTGITAVKQWRREILDKTDLREDQIAEYTGESKEIAPVTLATYQILTYRPDKSEEFPHFQLFGQRDWGLIMYDEVHLLPAPVFRITAQIQARRRLGLTATLVREDGREGDVFSLIGPKKYDVPWRELETRTQAREDLYNKFRAGEQRHLILSKVGNFAIDLPDANVLIQVSGTFGSRQEEAQRLGRILRPKENGEVAHFYSLVTRDTRELDFAHHRQMFLTEQGYSYHILDASEVQGPMRETG